MSSCPRCKSFLAINAWNEDISRRPLLTNSDAMIAQIFSELLTVSTNSPKLRAFQEMNFVLVPDNQPLVPIRFVEYPEESDPSPYPIPSNLPIEGWPSQTGTQTLSQVQRDTPATVGTVTPSSFNLAPDSFGKPGKRC